MAKLNAEQKMRRFSDKIISSTENSIITLQLDLTDFCVCKCNGCEHWKWPNKTKLSMQTIVYNILPFVKESSSLQSIVFSGGEPLLHPNVESIAKSIKGFGKNVGIITSGLGKSDIDFKTLSENCSWIRFSTDGFTPENYFKTRGVNMFDKWTDNLKTLLQYNEKTGCETRLNVTIHEYNLDEFTNGLCDFLVNNSLDIEVYFWLSREIIDMCRENFSTVELTSEKYYKTKKIMTTIQQKLNQLCRDIESRGFDSKKINISNVSKHLQGQNSIYYKSCFVPQLFLLVACDGNVFPCCYMYEPVFTMDKQQLQYVVGNVTDQSISSILKSEKYKSVVNEFRSCNKKFPQCKFCDRFDHINQHLNDVNQPIFL